MRKGAAALRADGFDGEVKVLTSCPSCLQGLSRFDDDAGTERRLHRRRDRDAPARRELDGRVRREGATHGGIERVLRVGTGSRPATRRCRRIRGRSTRKREDRRRARPRRARRPPWPCGHRDRRGRRRRRAEQQRHVNSVDAIRRRAAARAVARRMPRRAKVAHARVGCMRSRRDVRPECVCRRRRKVRAKAAIVMSRTRHSIGKRARGWRQLVVRSVSSGSPIE